MWNYNLNEGCSWQEILLSWARDMGAVKRTFLHPSSCSPPTDSHYLASETQNSAFGNQLVLGRWWESAVWWETWCLRCKLCCSWSKFLFSYVLISAKSGGKHHSIYSIFMPGKIGLQIWIRGGKNKKIPPDTIGLPRVAPIGIAKQLRLPQMTVKAQRSQSWWPAYFVDLEHLPAKAACAPLQRMCIWEPVCVPPVSTSAWESLLLLMESKNWYAVPR